mgnify:CR=1 FL=1
MKNKDILIKKIIYRSRHRGSKEMDLLLGEFVKRNIKLFNEDELNKLDLFLNIEDEVLLRYYNNDKIDTKIPSNTITKKFKTFKLKY